VPLTAAFLRRSGLAAGAGGSGVLLPTRFGAKGRQRPKIVGAPLTEHQTRELCTHCSVGRTDDRRSPDTGTGSAGEPAWDRPVSTGVAFAPRARRERHVHGDAAEISEKFNGEWIAPSWDQASTKIGERLLEIRHSSCAPDRESTCYGRRNFQRRRIPVRTIAAARGPNSIDSPGSASANSTTVAASPRPTWGYGSVNKFLQRYAQPSPLVLWVEAADGAPGFAPHILTGKEITRHCSCLPAFYPTRGACTQAMCAFRGWAPTCSDMGMLHHILTMAGRQAVHRAASTGMDRSAPKWRSGSRRRASESRGSGNS